MNETVLNSTESYLYLHPSENPATSLVSPVLDSTNYHSWSRSMITSLSIIFLTYFSSFFKVTTRIMSGSSYLLLDKILENRSKVVFSGHASCFQQYVCLPTNGFCCEEDEQNLCCQRRSNTIQYSHIESNFC